MSNLELRIDESSDLSFHAVDFVGIPFAPTVEVEDIEGGHRVSITSMGAEGKKTDEFDVMDGEDAATWLSGNVLFGELAEGTILTTDDAYAAPPESVEVFGKSTQAGTPTPDAPVPIKSVDDLTLYVCGFNVWDEQWERGYINDTTGANVGTSAQYIRSKNHIPVVAGVPYNFTCTSGRLAGKVYYYDANKAYLSFENVTFGAGADKTPPANAHYMRFWLNHPETYSNDICINISDTSRNGTYAPYVGTSIPIPLSNHIARSLPDGTEDTLTLTYQGPSEREGWGVYSKTLEQRVDTVTFSGTNTDLSITTSNSYVRVAWMTYMSIGATTITNFMSDRLRRSSDVNYGVYGSELAPRMWMRLPVELDTVELVNAWFAENPVTVQYQLATPVTHDLGTVELPILPCPLTVWADGGSAQPTMQMEYERALSIVIPRIEAAISDLATS